MAGVRSLDEHLPAFEFSERHALAIAAGAPSVDRALREVSLAELAVARGLLWLRTFGRRRADTRRPFLEQALHGAVLLEDAPGEGVVLGLTGQFWRLRPTPDPSRPRTAAEFAAYDRPDTCKAVLDVRVTPLSDARCRISTETRVHVGDPAARRAFRRYWRVIRPFSGLTRILLLRAVRRRSEGRTEPA